MTAEYTKRAMQIVWQCQPWLVIGNAVILVLQSIVPILMLYLTKLSIDAITSGISSKDTAAAFGRVECYMLLYATTGLIGALVQAAGGLLSEAQSLSLTDYVQNQIHTKSVAVDFAYYENPKYYDTLHRAQQEASHRPKAVVDGVSQIVQGSIMLVGIVGLLVSLNAPIALLLVAAAAPGVAVRVKYTDKMYRWKNRVTPTERFAWYLSWILTRDAYAKEVRLLSLGKPFQRQYTELRKKIRRERVSLATRQSAWTLLSQGFASLILVLCYLFIARECIRGAMTIGDLVLYMQVFQKGYGLLQQITFGCAALYESNVFLSYFFDFMDMKPSIADPDDPIPFPKPITGGIKFEGVSFCYPGSQHPALRNINLHILPGETVALVGENGCGKSTLVKLLCRLYDPRDGSISIDGNKLERFRLTDLRKEISVVFQDFARFNATVSDNISYGCIRKEATSERIVEAARRAGAHPFIESLDSRYDTLLGKWFDDGVELSTGQWQKMALARAFYGNAQIFVLDEPTSSIDPRAEYELFAGMRRILAGCTTVLISHRFSTVRMADRIVVMDKGVISEIGTHDELMRHGGLYATLFTMQASSYNH